MGAFRDMTGLRFGRLEVKSLHGRKPPAWVCVCDCGQAKIVKASLLREGRTRSCGCLTALPVELRYKSYAEYGIWCGMISRCENPNVASYKRYGGAGVSVCPRWRHDFLAFLADIGPRPSPAHSVDRIDPHGNYEPGNCRWATALVQTNNRRNTRRVIYRGVEMALTDAVRAAGSVIHREAAWVRIRTGWSVERAVETPRLFESPNSRARRSANDNQNVRQGRQEAA